jgi:hypothetical protein
MKEFRKTEDRLFICEECEKTFINCNLLSRHIKIIHNGSKIYYDKWLKEENDGICKWCKKETLFKNFKRKGYKHFCNDKCMRLYINSFKTFKSFYNANQTKKKKYGSVNNYNKIKQTKKERYGDEYFSNSKKSKQTKKERYGDENYTNPQKAKQTKKERYGDENYCNIEKRKQTNLKKYGIDIPFKLKEFQEKRKETNLKNHNGKHFYNPKKSKQTKKERYGDENYNNQNKIKQTCLTKYGAEHPNQVKEQYNKSLKTRLYIHQYEDTNLTYQGTYELDFIEKYLDKYPDLQNGPSIKYKIKGKNKVYHSDFFIPSLNLVIEIKSSWTLKLDLDIKAKKKATITNGFKYIMIMNKNYTKFNKLFS